MERDGVFTSMQVAALEKLEVMEHPATIVNRKHAQIGDRIKFLREPFRCRFVVRFATGQIGFSAQPFEKPTFHEWRHRNFPDENSILSHTLFAVTGPKIKLIDRLVGGKAVNEWMTDDIR